MACSSCGHRAHTSSPTIPLSVAEPQSYVVEASEDTSKKVKLRYYGGGLALKTTGCRSCGSSGQYSLVTTEVIQFATDDSPNGWFKETFSVGHDYYVTEKQAEYLLSLTFTNKAGQIAHKFKKED